MQRADGIRDAADPGPAAKRPDVKKKLGYEDMTSNYSIFFPALAARTIRYGRARNDIAVSQAEQPAAPDGIEEDAPKSN
jgi:hypothetical protein